MKRNKVNTPIIKDNISEWGEIDRQFAAIILVMAIFETLAYIFLPSFVLQGIILLALVLGALKNPFTCFEIYLVSSVYTGAVFPSNLSVLILAMVVAVFFIRYPGMIRRMKLGVLFLCALMIIPLSYLNGIKPSLNSALLMLLCVLLVITIYNNSRFFEEKERALIVWCMLCRGIAIALYFGIQMTRGVAILKYGRLSFDDNVKMAAEIVAIPLLMILCTQLEGKKIFTNLNLRIWRFIMEGAFSIILLLTAARGIIFAVIAGLVAYVLLSKREKKFIWKIAPILIFVVIFYLTNLSTSSYRISRIFVRDEVSGMNGRIQIWNYYLREMISRGRRYMLLGIGPGEVSRIGNIGFYAHSTLIDFFFSYGLLGFVIMIITQIKAIAMAAKSHNCIYIALIIATITMYSTHGIAANTSFFVLEIIILILAESSPLQEAGA